MGQEVENLSVRHSRQNSTFECRVGAHRTKETGDVDSNLNSSGGRGR